MTYTYGARPIKYRRTKAEIQQLRDGLASIVYEAQPATVRQIFYLATTRGLVPKTEKGYKTVQRLLVDMRLDDTIPFHMITDGGRTVHGYNRYRNRGEFLQSVAGNYRRNYWADSDVNVEIWLEKDALKGVVGRTVYEMGLDLYVTRGYSSITYLHEAAEEIRALWSHDGRKTYIYVLTDFDPSGMNIAKNIETKLYEFSDYADITVRRLAVTPEQVQYWNLPSRPNKSTDVRTAGFERKYGMESVELDAIHPDNLRKLVSDAIEAHMDPWKLQQLKLVEEQEREGLKALFAHEVEAEEARKAKAKRDEEKALMVRLGMTDEEIQQRLEDKKTEETEEAEKAEEAEEAKRVKAKWQSEIDRMTRLGHSPALIREIMDFAGVEPSREVREDIVREAMKKANEHVREESPDFDILAAMEEIMDLAKEAERDEAETTEQD